MNMVKKCFFILVLGCIVLSTVACSDKKQENEKAQETSETPIMTAPMLEIVRTTSTGAETTVSETSTTSTETSETTTVMSEATTTTTEVIATTTTEISTTTTTEATTTVTETTVLVPETTTAPVTVASAPETAPAESTAVVTQKFEPGIWWAYNNENDRYFCFYTGSDAGSFRDQENGLGVSFSYEVEGNETIVFHIGTEEEITKAQAAFSDSNTVILTWDNGTSETLHYQGLGNFETFHFYSNLELCEMALDYYEAKNGYRPDDASAEVQEDHTIAVHLYDNLNDHTSTSAWYTIDRFTAKGTDIMGNAIDLTEIS